MDLHPPVAPVLKANFSVDSLVMIYGRYERNSAQPKLEIEMIMLESTHERMSVRGHGKSDAEAAYVIYLGAVHVYERA